MPRLLYHSVASFAFDPENHLLRPLYDKLECKWFLRELFLIQTFNTLEFPVNYQVAEFLKTNFLDCANRYLVFTSHNLLDVDFWLSNSRRGYILVKLPVCGDVNILQTMHEKCGQLTPLEVALYGRLPSLIYFAKCFKNEIIGGLLESFVVGKLNPFATDDKYQTTIPKFLTALRSGKPTSSNNDAFTIRIDSFAYAESGSIIIWPLFFVGVIMDYLLAGIRLYYPTQISFKTEINFTLTCLSQTTYTGRDWELIVKIAILLQGFSASFCGTRGPFDMFETQVFPHIVSITMPPQIETLERARIWMLQTIQGYDNGNPRLFVFTSSFAQFPVYDTFLVAVTTLIKFVGLQIKLTKAYPTAPAADWLHGSYLVRGHAPGKTYVSPGRWVYLSDQQINELLGCSLQKVCPSNWPEPPTA